MTWWSTCCVPRQERETEISFVFKSSSSKLHKGLGLWLSSVCAYKSTIHQYNSLTNRHFIMALSLCLTPLFFLSTYLPTYLPIVPVSVCPPTYCVSIYPTGYLKTWFITHLKSFKYMLIPMHRLKIPAFLSSMSVLLFHNRSNPVSCLRCG